MAGTFLPHLQARVVNTPLLLHPDRARVLESVLSERIGTSGLTAQELKERFSPQTGRLDEDEAKPETRNPYRVYKGVAVITMDAGLVNRGAWVGASCGLVSYEGIEHQLKHAARDKSVNAIVLDMECPGGEATGAFELAKAVAKINEIKPVVVHVNGMAASAAYAIACGASKIVAIPSAIVGSIGVVWMHVDRSKALKNAGLKVTFIHAGDKKTMGNSFEPLAGDDATEIQAEIDELMKTFVAFVSKRRGMDEKAVRGTQARTFSGSRALELGLVDELGDFEHAINLANELAAKQSGGSKTGPKFMSDENKVDAEAIKAAAHAEGVKEGRADAVASLQSMLALDAAKNKSSAVVSLFVQGVGADAAKGILPQMVEDAGGAAAQSDNDQKPEAGAGSQAFAAHKRDMQQSQPEIGAAGGAEPTNLLSSAVSEILPAT